MSDMPIEKVRIGCYEAYVTQEQAIAYAAGKLSLMQSTEGPLGTLVDAHHGFAGQVVLQRCPDPSGALVGVLPGDGGTARALAHTAIPTTSHPATPAVVTALVIIGVAVGTTYLVRRHKRKTRTTEPAPTVPENLHRHEGATTQVEAPVDSLQGPRNPVSHDSRQEQSPIPAGEPVPGSSKPQETELTEKNTPLELSAWSVNVTECTPTTTNTVQLSE